MVCSAHTRVPLPHQSNNNHSTYCFLTSEQSTSEVVTLPIRWVAAVSGGSADGWEAEAQMCLRLNNTKQKQEKIWFKLKKKQENVTNDAENV